MLFNEIYGAYYNAVGEIINRALKGPVSVEEMRFIAEEKGFSESAYYIETAIQQDRWQMINSKGKTNLRHKTRRPLTKLEKSWLNAAGADPRVRLFTDDWTFYEDTPAIFSQDEIVVYDRYRDGDPYGDERYIKNFRKVYSAIKRGSVVEIEMLNGHGRRSKIKMLPVKMEYSLKDDKFRVYGRGVKFGSIINIGRILSCRETDDIKEKYDISVQKRTRTVCLSVIDERNAMQRVLMHFAHFEKEAEKTGDNTYRVKITYDKNDQTEMVIRVLSFGPMVRVVYPEYFKNLIKERLLKQKELD